MTDKKYTIFIKFADENRTRVLNCDFYEIEPSIGKILIPDEQNPDKSYSFFIYPGICYIEQIVQHYDYLKEYEERQQIKKHINDIRNQITDQVENFEESIQPDEHGRLYG